MDEWITAFNEAFDRVSIIPRGEWQLRDVYGLNDEILAVIVEQGRHQFGRRLRVETLNNGFGSVNSVENVADLLVIGEILGPQWLDSHPSSLALEARYPRAIWSGEYPASDDGGNRFDSQLGRTDGAQAERGD